MGRRAKAVPGSERSAAIIWAISAINSAGTISLATTLRAGPQTSHSKRPRDLYQLAKSIIVTLHRKTSRA